MTEFIRKKHVGVSLLNGRLKAFEIKDNTYLDKSIEEICLKLINDRNSENYWYDQNILKEVFTYVLNNTQRSLLKPALYIAIPYQISNSNDEDKSLILDAALQAKWNNVYMVDNFSCSAVGSGVEISEARKKIFIYSLNKLTYIGIVFAGSPFNVRIIKKGSNELTVEDIKKNIEELLNELSEEVPQQFTNMKLSKEDMEGIIRGWREDIIKKIYLSIPSQLKNKFGLNIGKYQLVYLNNENSVMEGLKKVIPLCISKKI